MTSPLAPTTFVGLALFVLFVLPGFSFTSERRRWLFGKQHLSVFQEITGTVAAGFVISCLLLSALEWLGHAGLPVISLRSAMLGGVNYLAMNLVPLATTVLVYVVFGSSVAVAIARLFPRQIMEPTPDRPNWIVAFVDLRDITSLAENSDVKTKLDIKMASGDTVSGELLGFDSALEADDRELLLKSSSLLTAGQGSAVQSLENKYSLISAKNIERVDFHFEKNPAGKFRGPKSSLILFSSQSRWAPAALIGVELLAILAWRHFVVP